MFSIVFSWLRPIKFLHRLANRLPCADFMPTKQRSIKILSKEAVLFSSDKWVNLPRLSSASRTAAGNQWKPDIFCMLTDGETYETLHIHVLHAFP